MPKSSNLKMQRKGSLRENGLVKGLNKNKFSISKLKELSHADDSRKSHRIIRSGKSSGEAYKQAGKGLMNLGNHLSDWGAKSSNLSLNDISDKIGVLVSELGETEIEFVKAFNENRIKFKAIRAMEDSIAPSRAHRQRLISSIEREEERDPLSPKLTDLQNQLVRTEAENLVGEMQLDNTSREVFKSSFQGLMDAFQLRAQKQMTLSYYASQLAELINDEVAYPGDNPAAYSQKYATQIMHQCVESMARLLAPVTSETTEHVGSDCEFTRKSSSSVEFSDHSQDSGDPSQQNILQVKNVQAVLSIPEAESYKAQLLSSIAEEQKKKELQAKSTVFL
ncbi:sporulation specific PIL domain protein Meu14 [Schizosaccharomyces pombe]|uniref:Meiotic expression up-regulated protein 14 n=1 Tax=Schizosaccharomyces pombe (strain 972 / ATCC 24843) TaxID=284812 RepID=MEU14_SCHPO|nr:sporulation protein Meu14 [Schizosaccharomyces pombe]O94756.1 RecName: Full=Meiotic expression up-regulated protein 14 [Schizosaccharomyces pombe 972h-]BAA32472.1 Meu14 [Schizosaccharomyces pombe]CAB37434.1 sporulation protein Meu14 [Schizosaccharomyces pombe]|eukprot:NP_596695.1 sporulation protein Meu14 [Schizosaccharomyces pombe]